MSFTELNVSSNAGANQLSEISPSEIILVAIVPKITIVFLKTSCLV